MDDDMDGSRPITPFRPFPTAIKKILLKSRFGGKPLSRI
jgi:hypothetical protein|tara:strand:+ start:1061 stop:1177 length:117 start_codon:yes stop_codon:yes gene_type:complete